MTKEDFKVHINEDNELIVTMEKKAEQKEEDKKKGTYLRREFSYTKFQQSLLLPDNVVREKIAAKVENGVMTIEIPKKKETEAAVAAARSRSDSLRPFYDGEGESVERVLLFAMAAVGDGSLAVSGYAERAADRSPVVCQRSRWRMG